MNAQLLALLTDLRDSRLMRLHGDAYMPRIESAIAALAAGDEVCAMDAIIAAYNTWPVALRKKLSLQDLRCMTGWAPRSNPADWAIDNSAGTPILVFQKCSVIESEQARYVLGLIAKDQAARLAAPSKEAGASYANHLAAIRPLVSPLQFDTICMVFREQDELANPPGDQRQDTIRAPLTGDSHVPSPAASIDPSLDDRAGIAGELDRPAGSGLGAVDGRNGGPVADEASGSGHLPNCAAAVPAEIGGDQRQEGGRCKECNASPCECPSGWGPKAASPPPDAATVEHIVLAGRMMEVRTVGGPPEILYKLEEYLENRQDVVDGDYGIPEPNEEMILLQELREAYRFA